MAAAGDCRATTNMLTIPTVSSVQNTNTTGGADGPLLCCNLWCGNLYVNPLPTVTLENYPFLHHYAFTVAERPAANVASPAGGEKRWRCDWRYRFIPHGSYGGWSVLTGLLTLIPTGCVNTSLRMGSATGQASDNLWAYPNPNNGRFQGGSTTLGRECDGEGLTAKAKVFEKTVATGIDTPHRCGME